MSNRITRQTLLCIVLLIELSLFTFAYGDNQPKVTSTTVTQPPNKQGLLNIYPQRDDQLNSFSQPNSFAQPISFSSQQSAYPQSSLFSQPSISQDTASQSDVIYSEPSWEERKKSKIDLVKKEKYIKDVHQKDRQLNLYKRPSQFSNLIKNQPLLEKQKAAISLSNGRLISNQPSKLDEPNSSTNYESSSAQSSTSADFSSEPNARYQLNNEFSQALNYLIKYINRQGDTKSVNGTEHTKNVNNILLKHARNLDRENCLLRLICEISSNEEDASDNQLIKEIRIVFSNKHQAPSYPTKRDSSFPFYYAGHVGAISGRAERCLEVFPVCSAKSEELLAILSNANKYAKNQTKLNRKVSKIMHNSKLERELYPTSESREFSEKMRNKMKKLHKQYIKKLN